MCSTLSVLTHEEIVRCRRTIANASKLSRQAFLIAARKNATDTVTGRMEHFQIGQHRLCSTAYCELFNITRKTLNLGEQQEFAHVQPNVDRVCPMTGPASAWITKRLKSLADYSPEGEFYVMPRDTMNKVEFWFMYMKETGQTLFAKDTIHLRTWYKLLNVR